MPTIIDVAKHCNVSFKTVSNVINGHPNVRNAMREKVWKAIEELGYQPSESARKLACYKKNSKGGKYVPRQLQIGCIVSSPIDRFNNLFYLDILHAVENEAQKHNHCLSFVQSGEVLMKDPLLYNYFLDRERIHGVISFLGNKRHLSRLANSFPVVSIGSKNAEADYIIADLEGGTRMALNYLLSLGHHRIGFIGVRMSDDAGKKSIRVRYKTYIDWMNEQGIPINNNWILECQDFNRENGFTAAEKLLENCKRPTAVFCACDELAYGALLAFRARNVDVPGEISVMGFDNLSTSELVYPSLTTIAIDSAEIGRNAIGTLVKRIKDPNRDQVSIIQKGTLVERDSCCNPRCGDR